MATGWSILISVIVVVAFSGVSWIASPKGDTQTVWRSSLILSAWACWLMWAITFLSQLNPLIEPTRSDMRQEYQ